jgi:hypothetical protein
MGRGDLAPRRHRGRLRWPVLLIILVVLAGLGYAADRYVWPHLRTSKTTTAAPPCTATRRAAALPAAKTVTLRVRNSTLRAGLASQVASALHHRGFHVHGVGNTTLKVTGTAAVRYSADRAQQAKTLAAQVSRPALAQVGGKGVLDLDLGPKWHALASPAAARAAERAARAAQRPTSTCSASPSPSASHG